MTSSPMTPLVSVVVRSMARTSLPRALASLAAQTCSSLEIVVVAASGASHPIPAPACGPHPVRFVASSARLPRPIAANAGLDAAHGSWVTFLDDDDTFQPPHLAGLVSAAQDAPQAGVVHSVARVVLADGSVRRNGQPFSLMQLYERNIAHLSATLVRRDVLGNDLRFDPAFDIFEDWDYFLQLAHRTPFHFVAQQTFDWHAEAGASGAGLGANHDDAKFAAAIDRIYAKWAPRRDALIDRVALLLQTAAGAAQRRDFATATAACREVLASSPNDPWGLNTLAMIERASGRMPEARRLQGLAVAVRPQDADLVYNLAMLCHELGDVPGAREHADRAVALAPDNPRYRNLAATLGAAPPARP